MIVLCANKGLKMFLFLVTNTMELKSISMVFFLLEVKWDVSSEAEFNDLECTVKESRTESKLLWFYSSLRLPNSFKSEKRKWSIT